MSLSVDGREHERRETTEDETNRLASRNNTPRIFVIFQFFLLFSSKEGKGGVERVEVAQSYLSEIYEKGTY